MGALQQQKQNWYILRCLIDVVCFLDENELPFRGYDESVASSNRGNYVGLLNLLRNYDGMLDNHLKNSTVFSGLSSDIQNDLINSISQVLLTEIKNEIKQSPFVAIIMDETTDITNTCQVSTVFRYVDKSGAVQERFIGFSDFSDDRTANALANYVFNVLTEYDCEEKLVAQTYDGAAVMSGEHGGLQALVKSKCSQAIFIHCYAHKMNLVLKNSVDHIKECKIFFSTLSGLASFFSKSSRRTHALDQEVKKRFPSVAPTRWNYNSRLVATVLEHKADIISLFESMIENGDKWDNESYTGAIGFLATLQDFDFTFLLHLFGSILPQADSIFEILQKKVLKSVFV